jgi:hypothetical protein
MPGMKTILANYSIPALIVIVAAMQFYNVQTNNLTLWKGGGFGMYADIHWRFREVWFFGLPKGIDPIKGFETEANYARQYPSDQNIMRLARKVRDKFKVSGFSVEVWSPRFQKDGTLTKERLNGVKLP